MQRLSLKTILSHLPITTYIGVILTTTLAYVLLDFIPIYETLPQIEPRISQALWQSLVWALYGVFISFWVCYGLARGFNLFQQDFIVFFKTYISEFLATKLRTLIFTSLWGLLFIVPGLVMALKYSLSELVVFFNPGFLNDRTQDPLKISSRTIGFYLPSLLILAALYFILPLVFDSVFEHPHFLYNPEERVAQIVLYSILNLSTYIYLFKVFYNERLTGEQNV